MWKLYLKIYLFWAINDVNSWSYINKDLSLTNFIKLFIVKNSHESWSVVNILKKIFFHIDIIFLTDWWVKQEIKYNSKFW